MRSMLKHLSPQGKSWVWPLCLFRRTGVVHNNPLQKREFFICNFLGGVLQFRDHLSKHFHIITVMEAWNNAKSLHL